MVGVNHRLERPMPNSRELIEAAATALNVPERTVRQHMRSLREAGQVTTGGRGITAPEMTAVDVSKLLLAICAAPTVQDSSSTIAAILALGRGEVTTRQWEQANAWEDERRSEVSLGVAYQADAIDTVAAVLEYFRRPKEIFLGHNYRLHSRDIEFYATIEVEPPPALFVSVTVGVRKLVASNWTYGRRKREGLQHVRRCREDVLLRLADALPVEQAAGSSL
jgi:DNA-binding transcriptional ArsR family regulator